jgi:hypothetical protein
MPGVFLLSPGPVFQDPNQQAVHANATIIASGSQVFTGYGASEVSLFVNVKDVPTGNAPTLKYVIQEVDPGDGATVIGNSSLSSVFTGPSIERITLASAFGGSIKVSWTVEGTTPSFTSVYATLVAKLGSIKLVTTDGDPIGDANHPMPIQVKTVFGFNEPDSSHLPIETLSELRQIRKLLEILTDESVQDEE